MATTQLSDVFVPELFTSAVVEQYNFKNGLVKSGIFAPNSFVQDIVMGAGLGGKIPMNAHISFTSSDSSVSTDDPTDLIVGDALSSVPMYVPKLSRNNRWDAAVLASQASGQDLIAYAASQVADYIVKDQQTILLNVLDGIYLDDNTNDSDSMLIDNSGSSITSEMVIDAVYSIGESFDSIGAMVIHPLQMASLVKEDTTSLIPASQSPLGLPIYKGIPVILDGRMRVDTLVYEAYFVGLGAIGYGFNPNAGLGMRVDTLHAGGNGRGVQSLFASWDQAMAVYGLDYTGAATNGTPSNAELAAASAWNKVAQSRENIKIVKLLSLV